MGTRQIISLTSASSPTARIPAGESLTLIRYSLHSIVACPKISVLNNWSLGWNNIVILLISLWSLFIDLINTVYFFLYEFLFRQALACPESIWSTALKTTMWPATTTTWSVWQSSWGPTRRQPPRSWGSPCSLRLSLLKLLEQERWEEMQQDFITLC